MIYINSKTLLVNTSKLDSHIRRLVGCVECLFVSVLLKSFQCAKYYNLHSILQLKLFSLEQLSVNVKEGHCSSITKSCNIFICVPNSAVLSNISNDIFNNCASFLKQFKIIYYDK